MSINATFLSPDLEILKTVLSSNYMEYYEGALVWLQRNDNEFQIQVQLTLEQHGGWWGTNQQSTYN